jgi:hypothetical protein
MRHTQGIVSHRDKGRVEMPPTESNVSGSHVWPGKRGGDRPEEQGRVGCSRLGQPQRTCKDEGSAVAQ